VLVEELRRLVVDEQSGRATDQHTQMDDGTEHRRATAETITTTYHAGASR
jgi:hypothetical protein